jgi:hypothetical protein
MGTDVGVRVFDAGLRARSQLATVELHQGFQWFSLVPVQMLRWYTNCTLSCILHIQPSKCPTKLHCDADPLTP